MKRIICVALCLCWAVAFAQKAPQEVSLVVSADGATKTQAIDNALRSAIEQTFGTFVSANTEILNDELVKDEIATVSSGNIQKYSEVAAVTLPNGNTSVTLNDTVSLSKLVSYAQSKGSECEFAGATFGANLRLYEFNKKNERIAIENMIKQLNAMRPIFDFAITVSDPIVNDKHFYKEKQRIDVNKEDYATIRISVSCVETKKSEHFRQILFSTVQTLGKTQEEINGLSQSGFQFHEYFVNNAPLFFYNEIPDLLYGLLYNIKYDFAVTDNNKSEYILNNPIRFIFIRTKYDYRNIGKIQDPEEKEHYRQAVDRHSGRPTIEWITDKSVWSNLPFLVPIKDISTISKITLITTVSDRTNYIYVKRDYMEKSIMNGDLLRINNQFGPETCYRTSDIPHSKAESVLNNPIEVLHIWDEPWESANSKSIGYYYDNENIKY